MMSNTATKRAVGVYYARHEGAQEQHVDSFPDRYRDLWDYAICQVDSRQGGYVVQVHPDGRETWHPRRHPLSGAQAVEAPAQKPEPAKKGRKKKAEAPDLELEA